MFIFFIWRLTKEQIQTRITWILDELKRYDVVSKDLKIDTRMFAIRSSKHVCIESKFIKKKQNLEIYIYRFLNYFGA